MKDKIEKIECGKCEGTGNLKCFNHIHRGICFACEGKGSFERRVKSDATKIREAAKKAQKKAYHSYYSNITDVEITRCTPLVAHVIEVDTSHSYYESHVMDWAAHLKVWSPEYLSFQDWAKDNHWKEYK